MNVETSAMSNPANAYFCTEKLKQEGNFHLSGVGLHPWSTAPQRKDKENVVMNHRGLREADVFCGLKISEIVQSISSCLLAAASKAAIPK